MMATIKISVNYTAQDDGDCETVKADDVNDVDDICLKTFHQMTAPLTVTYDLISFRTLHSATFP